jgi:hypothetical protein
MNESIPDAKKKVTPCYYNSYQTYIAKLDDLKLARENEKKNPPKPINPLSMKSTPTKPKLISPSTSSLDDILDLPPSPTQTPIPPTSPSPTQRTLSTLATRLLRRPSRYLWQFFSLLQDLSQDDSFLRTLLFALALIAALIRRDIRARLRLAFTWVGRKVRETIVMGGKVGYL